MRQLATYLVLSAVTTSLFSCVQTTKKNDATAVNQNRVEPGKLIPIDFSDKNYDDVHLYGKDTVTRDGWTIQYLVKDDSTKYNDIYIQWAKGNRKGLFYGNEMLLMRRYFIPIFRGENDEYIFFTHGCATTCSALLVLSKDSIPQYQDYRYVIDYDINNGKLVYIPETSYSLDTLEVSIVDLRRKKAKTVIFKNHCDLSPEEGCIDSIYFGEDQIKLFATLVNKRDKTGIEKIKENYTVRFDR